jgi:phosphoribosylanthranilate isomerase
MGATALANITGQLPFEQFATGTPALPKFNPGCAPPLSMECYARNMSVKVKICGITNADDAHAAAAAGADALGFVFCEKSPRCVPVDTAATIIRALPPYIIKVGVFVNADEHFVQRAIEKCGLNLLQFHGDEPPAFCRQFSLMSMKAFRIRDESSLERLSEYDTDAWLLDAYAPDKLGGTGETFDWSLAAKAQTLGRPIFLAGGLTPENVALAIRQVRPYGIDVSSGVEREPGKKNPDKVISFIQAAKAAADS